MKNIAFFFVFACFSLFFAQRSDAQCYVRLEDASGFNTDAYQDTLQAAAAKLCAIFDSLGFQGEQFKVYDFGFYLHQENTTGGYPEPFAQKIAEAQALSPYYLLFGKQTDKSGVYTKFWVDLVLPDTNCFYCIDQLSSNLRSDLVIKYEIITNLIYHSEGQSSGKYYKAEIATIDSLKNYILGLKVCCLGANRQMRNGPACTTCAFSQVEFESFLSNTGMASKSFTKIIDTNPFPSSGEQIGYEVIKQSGDTINLDNHMNLFKELIHNDFPSVSIKVYPFNFEDNCSNFENIENQFLLDNVDLGILLGVVGEDGESGKVFWKTISKEQIDVSSQTSMDSLYYFEKNGKFLKKESGQGGTRGIWLDRCGDGCNYEFSFADMIITPRTLTSSDTIIDGKPPIYPGTLEPYINKVMMMSKDKIFSQLAASKAFDPAMRQLDVFFIPISQMYFLWTESSSWDAPFDFSTKDFYADRTNYIFITDDGEYQIAHNYRNMGNFLWGAATYKMGVPKWLALSGAHYNNLNTDGGWDTDDDQWSIQLGRIYARKMDWGTIYGGRANIFRN